MEIPPLPSTVRISRGRLSFPSAYRHDWSTNAGLGVGVLLTVALLFSGVEDAVVFGLASLFAGIPALTTLGWVFAQLRRDLVVTAAGLEVTGWFRPRIERPARLALVGPVGRPIALVACYDVTGAPVGDVLAELPIGQGHRSFTFDGVTWIGETTAELLGVPLDDRRDPVGWRRWEEDPEYRAEVAFDIEIEDNAAEFREHHATRPVRPPSYRIDLDGMSAVLCHGFFSDTVLRADGRTVEVDGQAVALVDVRRAAVFYSKVRSKNSTSYYGELRVLCGMTTVALTTVGVTSTGGEAAAALNWAAEEIDRLARSGRPGEARGDRTDIPVELRRLAPLQRE